MRSRKNSWRARSRVSSVKLELRHPAFITWQRRLVALVQYAVFQHQQIDLGAHEASIGILRRTHDGLTTNIEARVYDHATSCQALEFGDHVVIVGLVVVMHRL